MGSQKAMNQLMKSLILYKLIILLSKGEQNALLFLSLKNPLYPFTVVGYIFFSP